MTLYVSNVRGKVTNTSYPYSAEITCIEDLAQAAKFDHVSANYRNGAKKNGQTIVKHRSNKNFLEADNLNMDCDNKQDNPMLPDISPEEWKTPADVQAAFPGVAFYAVPSRNHMKEKDGLCARPKYHYYFPLKEKITHGKAWAAMKEQMREIFPAFDPKALDAARFLYGVENPQPEYFDGEICIDEFLSNMEWDAKTKKEMNAAQPTKKAFAPVIPVGQRNSTLHSFALSVLTKYGNEDGKAHEAFLEYAGKCEQPLEDSELQTIWNSAAGYFKKEIATNPAYIAPAEYSTQDFAQSLIPTDYTDLGQANLLAAHYGERMKYTPATKWLVYNGQVWQENELTAQGIAQELTERQLQLSRFMVEKAQATENAAIESGDEAAEEKAKDSLNFAKGFRAFVLGERKSNRIAAALNEARPKLQLDVAMLDRDPYLLNTPGGTVDLRTGEMHRHDPQDYCTKITAVSPGTKGKTEFERFLDIVTCGDKDLAAYHQIVAGMKAVGKVFCENMEIDIGRGGNGKSTLNNAMGFVMGDYTGSLSAETLTVNCRKNKSPEYAELRGKRLVIAAELEEGMRLDTAIVKKLCSTDPIIAEKKFKAPFTFIPSHTIVLYTNHLPKVGTTDKGTWDRLVVVPFNANLRGMKGEIKNYADYLFRECGEYILTWIIEGAKRFIANQHTITPPECVRTAIEEYKRANDWLHNFLEECCEIDPVFKQKSGELYQEYRGYCIRNGDFTRSAAEFKQAIEGAGYPYKKTKAGAVVAGLRVQSEFLQVMPLTG